MSPDPAQPRLPIFHGLPAGRRQAVAAWTVWALMVVAGLWFTAAYAHTMPYGDDWVYLPVLAGEQPVSLAWLWCPHNEHRIPLPRSLYLGLMMLSGFDFRAPPFFNIMALSGLSLAMMLGARRMRGRTSLYDAFFPLLLLHWAHCENIVWGFQIQFITSVVLAGAVLLQIVRCGPQLSLRSAVLLTACLALLGLCGLNGLAYLPAMACWLAFAGVCRWRGREPHARRDGLLIIGLAGSLLALVAGYFVGLRRCNADSPSIWASLGTALQFLSGGIGPAAKEIWPVSGVLVAVACGYTLWQLYDVFRRQPHERVRAAGLFCFLGGIGSLALAIGVGRAFAGSRAGFMPRYITVGAPLLCLFYLQFTLYSSAAAKIHLQRTLALLMCALLVVNVPKGLRYAHYFQNLMTPLIADMRAGLPPTALATRHGEDLGFAPEEVFAQRLEVFRAARLGPYRDDVEEADQWLGIRRFCNLSPSREPTQRVCLLPGHSLTQYFQLPGDSLLCRIDVQISRCRGRRTLKYLDWHLCGVDPDQSRRLLAHGVIDTRSVDRDDYVSLAISAVSPLSTSLRLTPGEGPGASAARFALVF
jgi:hypothetical protein